MYNIAVVKDKKTELYKGSDGKEYTFPTLDEALVAAQYHGLGRQYDELRFVKKGADIESVTASASKAELEEAASSKKKNKPEKNKSSEKKNNTKKK